VKHDESPSETWKDTRVGVEVSSDSRRRLDEFEALLQERAVPLGLIAESDAPRIKERHVLDSLRAAAAVLETDTLAYDIGSGAGLPGLVVALARPGLHVVLVEPRRARAAFLELAVERLGAANVSVLVGRIQDATELADLCFARAYAPLPEAWEAALPRLRAGGWLVYFAGPHAPPPAPLPGASDVRVLDAPVLESAGSLIIMTR